MHLNFKLIPQVPSLRTPQFMREFAKILTNARRCGLRIQHYTIESNHVHILCEAESNDHVKRGMISLKSSIAWALRRIFGFYGKVFTDRYHAHHLKTPTEMRNALRYVLFNHAKHAKAAFFADVYSSIYEFEDASEFANLRFDRPPAWFAAIRPQLSVAQSWMQSHGWRKGR